jgi:hypothetical protein
MARVEGVTLQQRRHAHVLAAPQRHDAPSIDSQRKRIEASSSDQTSGAWNT